MFKAEDKREN